MDLLHRRLHFRTTEYLGPELLINGALSSTSNWVYNLANGKALISGGVCTFISGSTINTGIRQDGITLAVTRYKITFDVTNYTSGGLQVVFGVYSYQSLVVTITGTSSYTVYLNNTNASNITFYIVAVTGGFVGVIDNISCKKVL
jgi:hypothetical protein